MSKQLWLNAIAGMLVGAPIGYFIAEKLVTERYEGVIEAEIAAARDLHARINKVDQYATPEQAADALMNFATDDNLKVVEKVMRERGMQTIELEGDPVLVEGEPIMRNVFEDNSGVVDEGPRDPSKPYIISVEEFTEDMTRDKISLTYFMGDDTLVDEKDDVIPDIEGVVGQDSLTKFGHGSKDKQIVFVRNEVLDGDYEISADERKYTVAVLGLDDEDQDAHKRARKMRQDD